MSVGPTDGGATTGAGDRWRFGIAAAIEAAWLAGLVWLAVRG